jgi:hypothetical protein
MIDFPIRLEAIAAAARAWLGDEDEVVILGADTRAKVQAAIAAFCEAERLTVERMDWMSGTGSIPQQRIVGEWRDVGDD